MATRKTITPCQVFPEQINRDSFRSWLSGFTDGEGCFYIGVFDRNGRRTPRIFFKIKLRADDAEIIHLIHSFFQCGHVGYSFDPGRSGNHMPQVNYQAAGIEEIESVIIPNFEKYPLRAKKARDFNVWKEAAKLFGIVARRPRKTKGWRRGTLPSWSEEELNQFEALVEQVRVHRTYVGPTKGKLCPNPKTLSQAYLF